MNDYIEIWIASVIREPHVRLPYLYFPEVVEAKDAFTILPWSFRETISPVTTCVIVEGMDLGEDESIYRMMRTSQLYVDRVMVPNNLHWVQFGGTPPALMSPLIVTDVKKVDIARVLAISDPRAREYAYSVIEALV